MLRLTLGNALTYVFTAWFVAVFFLIAVAGIGFLGTLLYYLIF